MAQTIDLTPTWTGIAPALVAVLQDGTPEGQKQAKIELKRMAQTADLFNEAIKTLQYCEAALREIGKTDLANQAQGVFEKARNLKK
jgi:hypothetical protein